MVSKLNNNEPLNTDDKLVMVLKAQPNHFHHLVIELRNDIKVLLQNSDKRFEQFSIENKDIRNEIIELRQDSDKRFEKISNEIQNLYKAINGQTWRVMVAVGMIVILRKVVELFA